MSRRAELLLLYLRYLKKRQAREKGPAESGQICSVGRRKVAKKIAKNKRCGSSPTKNSSGKISGFAAAGPVEEHIWDVEPARTCLHQLIAGDGEAIHIAAAG
jgi:hypothetical protein